MRTSSTAFILLVCLVGWEVTYGQVEPEPRSARTEVCSRRLTDVAVENGEVVELYFPRRARRGCGFDVTASGGADLAFACQYSTSVLRVAYGSTTMTQMPSEFEFTSTEDRVILRTNQRRVEMTCTVTAGTPVPPTPFNSSSCECGVKQENRNKIVGGSNAAEFEYPFMVSVNEGSCGGSLINDRTVITAAHCIRNSNTVRLGLYEFGVNTGTVLRSARATMHPNYNGNTFDNDIAILTFDPVDLDANGLTTICLPEDTTNDYTGETVTAIGWGRLEYQGGLPDFLQEVDVVVDSNADCLTAYTNQITDQMICASAPGKDSCQGDSGGPLIHGGSSASDPFDLVGIVSWGFECAAPNFPGVYARVTALKDWILSEIGGEDNLCPRP